MILRTFNKGLSWDSFTVGSSWTANGISFINRDTGWISGTAGGNSFIWMTTNQGINFVMQTSGIGYGKIFFLRNKINGAYYGWCSNNHTIYKTTNSGNNWNQVADVQYEVNQLTMYNENIGWISTGGSNAYKTTNGGLNWIAQAMPSGMNISDRLFNMFRIVNSNKVYAVGGDRFFGINNWKGIIWVTTNGGTNWGFQQPDTSYPNAYYWVIDFLDSVHGWCENIKTTNGGGPILKIKNNNEQITNGYMLYQNFPNPFNQFSNINVQLSITKQIKIEAYDISGKMIKTIVNKKENSGLHSYKFDGTNLSSGVYFYSLIVDGIRINTKKIVLLK